MDKVISYTNVRENLAQIMTEVCEDHIVAHITRRNGQNCVLISEEEYDSIRESLYLFGNPANAAHLSAPSQKRNVAILFKLICEQIWNIVLPNLPLKTISIGSRLIRKN